MKYFTSCWINKCLCYALNSTACTELLHASTARTWTHHCVPDLIREQNNLKIESTNQSSVLKVLHFSHRGRGHALKASNESWGYNENTIREKRAQSRREKKGRTPLLFWHKDLHVKRWVVYVTAPLTFTKFLLLNKRCYMKGALRQEMHYSDFRSCRTFSA